MSVVLAMLLDAWLGEPKWLWSRAPHPAVLMGRVIKAFDDRFNSGSNRRLKGALTLTVLVLSAGLIGAALTYAFGLVAEVIIGAILLAHKSLVEHVQNVARGLRTSLIEGRKSVAMIVGRDVSDMSGAQVSRAAIESAAENFSDGVIAPLFWFLVAGLPGLMIYKITNTADSMIGYRTPKHEKFGWAAARFDDLLNLIPARLTALIFVLLKPDHWTFRSIRSDARLHRSPNAGWPEAALSRRLGIALAGPRSYHDEMKDYPWVNAGGRGHVDETDIEKAISLLWEGWIIALVIAIVVAVM